MSHVANIDLIIDGDMSTLKATCAALGWKLKEGQKTYAWFNRHVGDYPVPAGFAIEDLGKCEHAISIPGCRYEIGICKNPSGEGYVPLFDFFEQAIKQAVGGETAPKLRQRYAIEKARREAARTGHVVEEIPQPDGSVRLMMVKKSTQRRHLSKWNRMVSKAKAVIGAGGGA